MPEIVKLVISFLTLLTGFFSLFSPHSTVGFTGLKPEGGRGVTEIRAVLGGLFIALGLAPFIYRGDTFAMLGLTYLGIAVVRLVSIFVDKSSTQSNWISLAVEILFGAILMVGAW
ncbi:MAG: hypothetical protein OHK0031_09150 [Anaerolineales bacterium]